MQHQIVIIAGGKGTRIASVASDIPKALIPIPAHTLVGGVPARILKENIEWE